MLFYGGVYVPALEGCSTARCETRSVLCHRVEGYLDHSDAEFGCSTQVLCACPPCHFWKSESSRKLLLVHALGEVHQKLVAKTCSGRQEVLRSVQHTYLAGGKVFPRHSRPLLPGADTGAGELKASVSPSCAISTAKLRQNKVSRHSNTNAFLFIALCPCLQTMRNLPVLYQVCCYLRKNEKSKDNCNYKCLADILSIVTTYNSAEVLPSFKMGLRRMNTHMQLFGMTSKPNAS